MKKLICLVLLFTLPLLTSGCATLGDVLSLTAGALSLAAFGTGVGGFPTMDIALDTLNIIEASGTATKILVKTLVSPNIKAPSKVINPPIIENQPHGYELSNMKIYSDETNYQQSLCY